MNQGNNYHEVIVIGAGVAGIYQIKRLTDLVSMPLCLSATKTWMAPGIAIATYPVPVARRTYFKDIGSATICFASLLYFSRSRAKLL